MEGVTNTEASVASRRVVSKSSAAPLAILLMLFAVAGAIRIILAHFARSICPIDASAFSSQRLSLTGFPDTACNVVFVTN